MSNKDKIENPFNANSSTKFTFGKQTSFSNQPKTEQSVVSNPFSFGKSN